MQSPVRVMKPPVLARLREVTGTFADSAGATAQGLRLYVWFHEVLADEILDAGGVETGCVFRQKGYMTLLVYKATFDGVRRVVFVTARTPLCCIQILCRQFYSETLRWVDDKYA